MRRWFTAAAVLLLLTGAAKSDPAAKRKAALTQGGAVDPPPDDGPLSLVLEQVIKVDRWPKGVELTPDGTTAISTNFSDNTLSFIDTATRKVVRTLRTGKDSPVELAFSKDGKSAIVTGGWQRDEVMVLDVASGKFTTRIPGNKGGKGVQRVFPKVVVFSPDFTKFYVSYWTSNNVGVFDATTYELLGTVPAGVNPRGIAITPDGKKGYVANFDNRGNSVTVFQADAAPFPVITTIAPMPNPRHVAMDPLGRSVFVSLFGEKGGVVKIDVATDKVIARSVATGKRTKTIKLSRDGRWLFGTNFGADTVSVWDAETLAEVEREPTGDEPCGLDVSADGKVLWTTDWNDDQVRVWSIVEKNPPPPTLPPPPTPAPPPPPPPPGATP